VLGERLIEQQHLRRERFELRLLHREEDEARAEHEREQKTDEPRHLADHAAGAVGLLLGR